MKRVLVTGGNGYIGRHLVNHLAQVGEHVAVMDTQGSPDNPLVRNYRIDIRNRHGWDPLFREVQIYAVIHLAALSNAVVSVAEPTRYYDVNVGGTTALLDAAYRHGVRHLVFASTAAVYGSPNDSVCPEDAPSRPIHPYGKSKAVAEEILNDTDLHRVILRYFNVAGHNGRGLIQAAWRAVRRDEPLEIYGTGHGTRDGTCIRDYVHVHDAVDATVLALDYLRRGGVSTTLNVGSGSGRTVMQVTDAVERVSGRKLNARKGPARDCDVPASVADTRLIRSVLGWSPRRSDLDRIVESAAP